MSTTKDPKPSREFEYIFLDWRQKARWMDGAIKKKMMDKKKEIYRQIIH